MCNKCENIHSKLFKNHQLYKLDKNITEIFTGFCQEYKHNEELEFFCKDHNTLCCAACIAKINKKGKGKHGKCNICIIEEIKNEKKNKFNENITNLEKMSINLEKTINELKKLFEKIKEDKEKLKLEIQTIFTNLRNIINEREDELILEIETKFDEEFVQEDIIKESEKLPNKIKNILNKGKISDKDQNEDKNLNSLIYYCINSEKDINNINLLSENIKKCENSKNIQIKIHPDSENDLIKLKKDIKLYGKFNIIKNNKKVLVQRTVRELTFINTKFNNDIFPKQVKGSGSK